MTDSKSLRRTVPAIFCFCLAATLAVGALGLADETAPKVSKITSYDDVLALLEESGMKFQANKSTQSAIFGTESGGLRGTMLIRWDDKAGIVQIIQSLPLEVPADRIPAVESALARANHALPVPGIGLDHDNRIVYYRMSVVFKLRGSLQANELNALIWGTLHQAANFYQPLKRIALENANPKGILADIEQEAKSRAARAKE